jgi:acetate kinase
MLAAALGGVDGFVFTAGIGENSPSMRARIAERLAWLGGGLYGQANTAGASKISAAGSGLAIHVVPTDEELMIARHTMTILSEQRDPQMTQGNLHRSKQPGSG